VGEQLVLGDHPLVVLDQVAQDLEHLGLERDRLPVAQQALAWHVDRVSAEAEVQDCPQPSQVSISDVTLRAHRISMEIPAPTEKLA